MDISMDHIEDIFLEKINDAELVLVGIGEEFGESLEKMKDVPKYKSMLDKLASKDELHWMMPFIERIYLKDYISDRVMTAYTVLEKMLDNKNYFIVSTRMDDYIFDSKLIKEKIVTPCGGYRFWQCADGCEKQVFEVDEQLIGRIHDCLLHKKRPEEIEIPLCTKCGKELVFNNIKAKHYVEEGYLEQWNNYTKWLQGTVNKKLCVLELGVGMQYPTVIRWPFEKIVFFNQKSSMFRIHSRLYQLTEEIKDRSYKIEEKPVDFLINRFV